jgi:uncharacterized membrane protein
MSENETTQTRGRFWWVGLLLLSLLFVSAGAAHFLIPNFYMPAMPPYIPWPLAMIYFTGVAEILGGIGVLVPNGFVFRSTRTAAAWGLVALLIAVWPVHINMCLHPQQFPTVPLWLIWIRLPLQITLIAWAWYYTR